MFVVAGLHLWQACHSHCPLHCVAFQKMCPPSARTGSGDCVLGCLKGRLKRVRLGAHLQAGKESRIFAQSPVPACSGTASCIIEEGLWHSLCLYFLAETRGICALPEPGPDHGRVRSVAAAPWDSPRSGWGRGLEREPLAPSPQEKSIPQPQSGPTAPAVPSGTSPATSSRLLAGSLG